MTCFFYPLNIWQEVVTKALRPRRYLCLVDSKPRADSLAARHVLISCKHCQRFVTFGDCDAIVPSYSINVVNIIPDLCLNLCQMNVIILFGVFMKPWDVPWDSIWETLGFGSQFREISTTILGFRKIIAGNTALTGVLSS